MRPEDDPDYQRQLTLNLQLLTAVHAEEDEEDGETESLQDLLQEGESRADLVRRLLEAGASPNFRDFPNEETTFWVACEIRPELIPLLLQYGASADVHAYIGLARNPSGNYILHDLFDYYNLRNEEAKFAWIVQHLLAAGANPNVVDYVGYTPLFYAADSRNTRLVATLLDGGATPVPSSGLVRGSTGTHRTACVGVNEEGEIIDDYYVNDLTFAYDVRGALDGTALPPEMLEVILTVATRVPMRYIYRLVH